MTAKAGGDSRLPFLYLALPVMDEPDLLQRLLDCIAVQTYRRFSLFVCVNQPDAWWHDPGKIGICRNNAQSLKILKDFSSFRIISIDRSTKGNGWTGKKHGVGYARKTVMDAISEVAGPEDIIVSLDADIVFSENYLESIASAFEKHPLATALSVPYFHQTPFDTVAARAVLRYEIYMRHYYLNLARIASPYAFTALGSAMAIPVWAFRATGGMTPKLSGEDFYFLQKLRKFGEVLMWCDEMVYPEARFSDRVFFGTGPAMIRGASGDWSSYPVYPLRGFDAILETYGLLPEIYSRMVDTDIIRFMSQTFREDDPVQPLRTNHRDPGHFTRAFHEKFDGLRILQYMKMRHAQQPSGDEKNLWDFLDRLYPNGMNDQPMIDRKTFSFAASPVEELEKIRMFLFKKEMDVRATSVPV